MKPKEEINDDNPEGQQQTRQFCQEDGNSSLGAVGFL